MKDTYYYMFLKLIENKIKLFNKEFELLMIGDESLHLHLNESQKHIIDIFCLALTFNKMYESKIYVTFKNDYLHLTLTKTERNDIIYMC